MRYETVYDILQASDWQWLIPLAPVAFGLVLIAFGWRILRAYNSGRAAILVVGGVGAIGLGAWAEWRYLGRVGECKQAAAHPTQAVEGKVADFSPLPAQASGNGPRDESFSVGGVRFAYHDIDASQCGFKQTAAKGGPIRPDLPVRITYYEGRILKLEVARP